MRATQTCGDEPSGQRGQRGGVCRSLGPCGALSVAVGIRTLALLRGEASEDVGRGGMGPDAGFKGSSRVEGLKGQVETSESPLPSWRG